MLLLTSSFCCLVVLRHREWRWMADQWWQETVGKEGPERERMIMKGPMKEERRRSPESVRVVCKERLRKRRLSRVEKDNKTRWSWMKKNDSWNDSWGGHKSERAKERKCCLVWKLIWDLNNINVCEGKKCGAILEVSFRSSREEDKSKWWWWWSKGSLEMAQP